MFATIGKSMLAVAAPVVSGVLIGSLTLEAYDGVRRGVKSLYKMTRSSSSNTSSRKKHKAKKPSARKSHRSPSAPLSKHKRSA